jgi:hypothetical protein
MTYSSSSSFHFSCPRKDPSQRQQKLSKSCLHIGNLMFLNMILPLFDFNLYISQEWKTEHDCIICLDRRPKFPLLNHQFSKYALIMSTSSFPSVRPTLATGANAEADPKRAAMERAAILTIFRM